MISCLCPLKKIKKIFTVRHVVQNYVHDVLDLCTTWARMMYMKTVSASQFRQKLFYFLENLPVAITRKGSICAYLVADVQDHVHVVQGNVQPDVRPDVQPPPMSDNSLPQYPSVVKGWCEGHFEKGAVYPLETVTYENVDGESAWTKKLCPKCLEGAREHIKHEGGCLIIKSEPETEIAK